MKILDRDGLAYFWTKIKAYVASLVAPKADDASVVHKTGTELVQGDKTFKPDGEGDSTNGSVALVFRNRYFDRTSINNPSRYNWTTLIFGDKQNEVWVRDEHGAFAGRLGAVECYTDSLTGTTMIRLCCHKGLYSPGVDEEVMSCLRVGVNADGTPFVRCTSTPETTVAAEDVVTRDWIPKDGRIVHTSGDETVAGNKTFTGYITLSKSAPGIALKNTNLSKGTKPSIINYYGISWTDANGIALENRLGIVETSVDTNGNTSVYFRAYKNASGSSDSVSMGLCYDYGASSGYTFAPTPDASDNSTKIATTEFVKAQGYLTSHQTLPTLSLTTSGSGNAITALSVSNHAIIATKAITFADDSNVVHKTGNETIAGTKTFSTGVVVHERGAFLTVENYHIDKGVAPSTTNYHTLVFCDKNGNALVNRFGFVENFVEQGTGKVCTKIGAYKNVTGSSDYAELCLWHWPDGTKYATCPTPPSSSNNITIATTEWVNAKGYITSSGSITGNAATATELATARTISLSGAVTGSASFDGSSDSGISTVWRSCLVGQSGGSGTNPWYKVATCVADRASDDIIITFLVETTYYSHATGILKIHVRTNASKVIDTSTSEIFWLSGTSGIVNTLSDYVLVCPSAASSTVELWTRISGGYQFRRFVVLSEGSRTSTWTRWTLLDAASAGQAASITTEGTQIASVLAGRANNVTGTVAIANGGTGATTRLDAIKALTDENVGTDATDFITAKTGWSKCGYTSVADVKTVLGLKSAAYTDSTDYASRFKSSVMDVTSTTVSSDQWYVRSWLDKNDETIMAQSLLFTSSSSVRTYSIRLYDSSKSSHWLMILQIDHAGTNPLLNMGGVVKPQASNAFSLGTASSKWTAVYATNGSIQTSDERLKEDVGAIPETILDAWDSVEWLQFRMRDSVAEKGAGARLHSGIIAQRVRDAFASSGLDASKYGFFCFDRWDASPASFDENGNVAIAETPAGDQYSIRYDEALAIEAAYMRRENARLKKRIADLEERLAALELRVS